VLPGGINRYNKQLTDRMAGRIWFGARTEENEAMRLSCKKLIKIVKTVTK